ncbi:hypothetical protein GQ53DRAFT_891478 [Thozetella sp. PMI_491]|nr:hypothetical protein GQ53DRAFT_891478 [Thozetella sp. PMI_491]
MPTTISTGWTPPPLSVVNISDCNATAAWLGAIAQAGLDLPHETGQPFLVARMIPIDVSLDYVRSAIPNNYSPAPDDVDLFAWYTEFWINSTVSDPESEQIEERAELFPLLNCSEKLCPALKWEGDPDVSGIGMIVTYYIEAVLSTIFLLASLFYELRQANRHCVHLFFIIMLSIVLNIFLGLVGPRSTPDWTASNVDGTLAVTVHDMFWEQACDDIPFKQTLIGFYFVGLLVLIFNAVWWVGYTLSGWETAVNRIPQHLRERFKVEKIWRLWDHHEHRMRIFNGSLLGALMWIFLGMFHRYSYILSQKAGGSD